MLMFVYQLSHRHHVWRCTLFTIHASTPASW